VLDVALTAAQPREMAEDEPVPEQFALVDQIVEINCEAVQVCVTDDGGLDVQKPATVTTTVFGLPWHVPELV